LPYLSSVKYASKNKRVPDNAPSAKNGMDSTSHHEAETSIVQRYLREGLTESARLLAKRPVIVGWPEMGLGQIIWPKV
jgi:hypothetical protein